MRCLIFGVEICVDLNRSGKRDVTGWKLLQMGIGTCHSWD